jgi:hypothetical protein
LFLSLGQCGQNPFLVLLMLLQDLADLAVLLVSHADHVRFLGLDLSDLKN